MKVAVHNGGKSPMYVAGRMIPPGETEHIEAAQLPPELQGDAAGAGARQDEIDALADAAADPLAELQANSSKIVIAALPDLDVVKLQRLAALEEASDKPRKTVLEAIAAAHLEIEAAMVGGAA